MKYIFIINNHLLYYNYLNIIEINNLDINNCIFISVKNYKNYFFNKNIKHIDMTYLSKELNNHSLSFFDTKKLFTNIGRVQDFINESINENFEIYTHMIDNFVYTFTFHEKFQSVHFVEDGLMAYHKNKSYYYLRYNNILLNRLYYLYYLNIRQLNFFNFFENFFIQLISIFSNKYKQLNKLKMPIPCISNLYHKNCESSKYYSIYEDGFPFIDVKKKIIIGNIYKDPNFNQSLDLSNCSILLFDANICEQRKLISESDFVTIVKNSLDNINKKNKIFYKFHPAQSDFIKTELKKFIEDNFLSEELNRDYPIEQIIVNFKNIHFIGFLSSLLFYAYREGHRVTSLIEFCDNPRVMKFVKEVMSDTFVTEVLKFKNNE